MQTYFYNLATDKTSGIIAGILKLFLLLFSFLYELAVRFTLFLYKIRILRKFYPECKVISVGNITLGGTGKTPLVETIARSLMHKGLKIAILTRGYKKELSPEGKPDEASMLSENLGSVPILVGRNRAENAKKAVKEHGAQAILLDDGFQHWKLYRDLDIITIDSTNPFGNKRLIPRGILRESLSSLKRTDIFIITKTDFGKYNLDKIRSLINRYNPDALIVETKHASLSLYKIKDKQEISVSQLKDKKACLLASIADPETFEKMLLDLGLKVALKYCYLDHYQYRKDELDNVIKACAENNINTIITTEKDIPKIKAIYPNLPKDISLLALKIGIKFTKNEEVFFERLYSVYNR